MTYPISTLGMSRSAGIGFEVHTAGMIIMNHKLLRPWARWVRSTVRFFHEEDGPTAVEYAVLLALIVVTCIASVQAMANATANSFDNTATEISNAFSS